MNLDAPTHLLIVFRPENEEQVHTLVVHAILSGTEASCIETGEQPMLFGIATSPPLVSSEKLISLALSRPLSLPQINAIAELVAAGMISGFIVRGNIDLGGHAIPSRGRGSQGVSDDQEHAQPLTERARYQLAVDTGTTEYYDAALRREAFRQDE